MLPFVAENSQGFGQKSLAKAANAMTRPRQDQRTPETIPLPKCRMIRHNSPRDSALSDVSLTRALFIVVLVFTVAPMGVGQTPSARGSDRTSVEEAIKKLDNERIQAQIHADAMALDRIYAADFIGVGPSGTVRTKPQVILDFTSGDLKFQSITTDDVQVRVYGNAAVETGRSIMNGQDKGKTVPRDTRFTRVWVKQQGRWRLVANHYSSQTTSQ